MRWSEALLKTFCMCVHVCVQAYVRGQRVHRGQHVCACRGRSGHEGGCGCGSLISETPSGKFQVAPASLFLLQFHPSSIQLPVHRYWRPNTANTMDGKVNGRKTGLKMASIILNSGEMVSCSYTLNLSHLKHYWPVSPEKIKECNRKMSFFFFFYHRTLAGSLKGFCIINTHTHIYTFWELLWWKPWIFESCYDEAGFVLMLSLEYLKLKELVDSCIFWVTFPNFTQHAVICAHSGAHLFSSLFKASDAAAL